MYARRGLAALVLAAMSLVLLAPGAAATPESDAADAITAAWEAAGGESSPLGAKQGEVYPIGEGFAEDFAGGKMFYTPATGARALYGEILAKYESLGGPDGSGLGFPDSDETLGMAGPDSRFLTFSASDHPLMYYTPEHGAFVVRGEINAAWDKLGSSSSPLGVPISDEVVDGDVITQRFAGGQLSWNRATKVYSTDPAELADQLNEAGVADAAAAITQAWQEAGGETGRLGPRQGDRQPVGADGAVQEFANGKIFFSPATGAAVLSGEILDKYESLGGPGGDLGFPSAGEADGPLPGSRVATFAGAGQDDQPTIFYTPEHGAFVVRGVLQTAWEKLGGATGDLGAPAGDQTVDGASTAQEFTNGKISWNSDTNTFNTTPERLAASLEGLQLPGQNSPAKAAAATAAGDRGFTWHWWWLAAAAGVLLLAGVLALLWWRRRQAAERFLMRRNGRRRTKAVVNAKRLRRAADHDAAEDSGTTEALSTYHDGYDGYRGSPGGPLAGADPKGASAPAHGWFTEDFAPTHTDEPDEPDELDELDDADDVDTAPTRIPTGLPAVADFAEPAGRHAADAAPPPGEPQQRVGAAIRPAFHLPLEDPYRMPEGYPIKASTLSGLYYTPDNALYDDTLAEVWFASEEVAQFNGFLRAS